MPDGGQGHSGSRIGGRYVVLETEDHRIAEGTANG